MRGLPLFLSLGSFGSPFVEKAAQKPPLSRQTSSGKAIQFSQGPNMEEEFKCVLKVIRGHPTHECVYLQKRLKALGISFTSFKFFYLK